jgi:hypothetical protein
MTSTTKKVIIIGNKNKSPEQIKKEAAALIIKVPDMAGATIHEGFTGAEEAVAGAIVLAEYLPANIQAKAKLFIECASPQAITQAVKDVLPAEEIANTMQFIRAYHVREETNPLKWFMNDAVEDEGVASE